MTRGPYRKPSKLSVKQKTWMLHDVVQTGGSRWIIRELSKATGRVVLHSSNTAAKKVLWTTTVDRLPKKAATS